MLRLSTPKPLSLTDIALKGLPAVHRPWTRHLEQSPEEVAQCFLELQSNLNRKGIQMISMIGKRPNLPGQPEKNLKEAFLAKYIRFFRADKAAEHKFAFEKDDVHVKPWTFKKCIDGVVKMAKTGYNAGRDRRRCRNKGSWLRHQNFQTSAFVIETSYVLIFCSHRDIIPLKCSKTLIHKSRKCFSLSYISYI